MATRAKQPTSNKPAKIWVELTTDDLETLVVVANFYLRSWGFMRHVVRLTTFSDTRGRLGFIKEESQWLERFAATTLDEMRERNEASRAVLFTLPALIAFWGRLHASLTSKRARRKLSEAEISHREDLGRKLCDAIKSLPKRLTPAVAEAIETRRLPEQEWMKAQLTDTDS